MNRSFVRVTTAVAAVSAAALFFPAVATSEPVSAANCAEVSTGTDPNGWGNPFPEEAGPIYSDTTEIDPDGSLQFSTDSATSRKAWYHDAGNVPLSQVAANPLTFSQTAGNANWQIRVTGAATVGAPPEEEGFATFVWVGTDGNVDAGASDRWWATRELDGFPRGATGTLAALSAAAGDGTMVTHYGISSQPGGAGGTVYVDHVSFNGCLTNFKATGSADGGSSGSSDGGSSSGSLGGGSSAGTPGGLDLGRLIP